MKKQKKNYKLLLENIAIFSFFIILIIITIVKQKYGFFVFIGICLLFYLGIIIYFHFIFNNQNKLLKKINKEYNEIKGKEQKNPFDNIFLLTHQDKIDDLIKEDFKKEKMKNISEFCTTVEDVNYINSCYSYLGFFVNIDIYEKGTKVTISPSSRYSSSNNKLFNKDGRIVNIFDDLSEINEVKRISMLVKDVNNEIDSFIKNNPVDELFNGRLDLKLENIKYYYKQNRFTCIIAGIIFLAFCIFGITLGLTDKEYQKDNLLGFIVLEVCLSIFALFSLYSIYYGLYSIKQLKRLNDDLENKNTDIIKGKITKIRIVTEKQAKFVDDITVKYVILMFDNDTFLLPLSEYISFIDRFGLKKKCCNEIKNMDVSLKYLKTSKIIIDGEKMIVSKIKKFLKK